MLVFQPEKRYNKMRQQDRTKLLGSGGISFAKGLYLRDPMSWDRLLFQINMRGITDETRFTFGG